MKKYYIIFLLLSIYSQAQISFEKFNSNFQEKPKPILLFFSTKWCSYCLIQKKQIEKDKSLFHFLNNGVYYLEVDAESHDTIYFLEKVYQPKEKLHAFVEEFISTNEQINYPYWVLISKDLRIEMTYSGLIKNKSFKILLEKYFKGAYF
ncbi:hypothetical protein IF128_13115 [Empedobacter stercoris]|uniref:Thioredoxin family protein n=1 Tax=Empedobacter stercoris TaxID=1628248 RepID=A0ABX1WQ37_9FLAO|nr:hypothetical protein [Empedobacter stercoris]MCA4810666.1 hypothetical protein [Empedobacter stercoris]NOJ76633.1 hypothetical protein [Empedobacter stercoris]QNT14011.1 hypothetical protein HNV03_04720 [Empedobacter stercoris]